MKSTDRAAASVRTRRAGVIEVACLCMSDSPRKTTNEASYQRGTCQVVNPLYSQSLAKLCANGPGMRCSGLDRLAVGGTRFRCRKGLYGGRRATTRMQSDYDST